MAIKSLSKLCCGYFLFSLQLTVEEWDEWGNPNESEDMYEYQLRYEPYSNLKGNLAYPDILILSAMNDPRVLYTEPAKFTAKLRELGYKNVLLKMNMSGGHFGKRGVGKYWIIVTSIWRDSFPQGTDEILVTPISDSIRLVGCDIRTIKGTKGRL